MTRRPLAILSLTLLVAGPASAQFPAPPPPTALNVGRGSTVGGDMARGRGVELIGEAQRVYAGAVAGAIDADTYMKLSEYADMYAGREEQRRIERVLADQRARRVRYEEILRRIRESPDRVDMERGNALNAKLDELLKPEFGAYSRISTIPVSLSTDDFRKIPFKAPREGATLSMRRLGNRKSWPPALNSDHYAAGRKAYHDALEGVIEAQINRSLSRREIDRIVAAVEDLQKTFDRVDLGRDDAPYREGVQYLHRLRLSVDDLSKDRVGLILADLSSYSCSTVEDLMLFVQRHHLQVGEAETPEERQLFPKLYGVLNEQVRVIKAQLRNSRPAED